MNYDSVHKGDVSHKAVSALCVFGHGNGADSPAMRFIGIASLKIPALRI